nr:hypothetical protein [uncultured Olsenella sp.]
MRSFSCGVLCAAHVVAEQQSFNSYDVFNLLDEFDLSDIKSMEAVGADEFDVEFFKGFIDEEGEWVMRDGE